MILKKRETTGENGAAMRAGGKQAAAVLAGLLVIVLLAAVFAVQKRAVRNEACREEERKIIAVSTIGPTHAWAGSVMYYAEEKLKEVPEENGWDYICKAADNSYEQSQQLVELVEQDVDCMTDWSLPAGAIIWT